MPPATPAQDFPRLQSQLVEPVQVLEVATGQIVTIAKGDFSPRRYRRLEGLSPAESGAAGLDLTGAPDVGEKTAEAVLAAGYHSIEAIAEASARKLSHDAGIPIGRARSLIAWARETVASRAEAQEPETPEPVAPEGDLSESSEPDAAEPAASDEDA